MRKRIINLRVKKDNHSAKEDQLKYMQEKISFFRTKLIKMEDDARLYEDSISLKLDKKTRRLIDQELLLRLINLNSHNNDVEI